MAVTKEHQYEEKGEDFSESGGSDPGVDSDDSVKDPSYIILEETHAKFSKLSIKTKSKARWVNDRDIFCVNGFFEFWFNVLLKCWNLNGYCCICSIVEGIDLEADLDGEEVVVPELNQKDAKSFEHVQNMIQG